MVRIGNFTAALSKGDLNVTHSEYRRHAFNLSPQSSQTPSSAPKPTQSTFQSLPNISTTSPPQPQPQPPRPAQYPRHPAFSSNRLGGIGGGGGSSDGGFKVDRPLAGVLVIGGILLFVSMSLTAAVIVFCKKKNTVFVMQKCEEGQEGDDSDLELDDVLTDADSSADWRSGDMGGGGGGGGWYTPLALSSLPKLVISFDTDSGRRLVSMASGTSGTGDDADLAVGIFGNRFARDFAPSDQDDDDESADIGSEAGDGGCGGRRLRRIRRFDDGGGGGGDLCLELRRSVRSGSDDDESGKLMAGRDAEEAAATVESGEPSGARQIGDDKLMKAGGETTAREAEEEANRVDEDEEDEDEDDEGAEAEEAKPLRQLVTQV